MNNRILRCLMATILLMSSQCLTAQLTPTLLKDINTTSIGIASTPVKGTWMGSNYYFAANNGLSGVELWKTDGTTGNTILLKDIYIGSGSSSPNYFTVYNSVLYFAANDGINGVELWKTDGTTAGTVMVKDISSGTSGSQVSNFWPSPAGLLFTATNSLTGDELWKTDGTAAGTVVVKEIIAGYIGGALNRITGTGTKIYFAASDAPATGNYELYKSDGTAAGTGLVKEINPLSYSGGMNGATFAWGENLYFGGDNGSTGSELWKSDGTTAGTVMVKEINPGSTSGIYNAGNPNYFCPMNGKLYFSANTVANGTELWVTDGTNAGTVMVKDINPGTGNSSPFKLTAIGNTVYFRATDGTNGTELWKSDGTSGGTVMVKDINSAAGNAAPDQFTVMNGALYFLANNNTNGIELWKSDGSNAGTTMVKDINTGATGSAITNIIATSNYILFSADNGINGLELWKSDGTTAGTNMLKNISPESGNSGITSLTTLGTKVIFSANDGTNGQEVWGTDGTPAGTILLKDINTTAGASSSPLRFTLMNTNLYFAASAGTTAGLTGTELYKTDGTVAGTVLVKDINPGTGNSTPRNFCQLGSALYFGASDGVNGNELWKTDGTNAGTVMVKDIVSGSGGSSPGSSGTIPDIISNGSMLLFAGLDQGPANTGWELFGSTGVTGNGGLIKDINTTSAGANSAPSNFAYPGTGNVVYFEAYDANGMELWKSDGTVAGTTMVKEITPGAADTDLGTLTAFKNKIFFTAYSATDGVELWVSDGTNAGTVVLKNINPGLASSTPQNLTVCGNYMYFSADNGVNGRELWRTDGTAAGTIMVTDIVSGAGSSNPASFFWHPVLQTVYFTAYTPAKGVELWAYNGTATGLYAELVTGPESSNFAAMTLAGNRLVFVAGNSSTGLEVYTVPTVTGVLPLNLLEFTAQPAGSQVNLQWKTSNEINTAKFIVERSADGSSYAPVAIVAAAGSGNNFYNTTDTDPFTGNNYYRLKMMDIDGSFTYSDIVLVRFNAAKGLVLSPVPARSQLTITLKDNAFKGQPATVINASGAVMAEIILNNVTRLEISSWANGVYHIRTAAGETFRFIKQ